MGMRMYWRLNKTFPGIYPYCRQGIRKKTNIADSGYVLSFLVEGYTLFSLHQSTLVSSNRRSSEESSSLFHINIRIICQVIR